MFDLIDTKDLVTSLIVAAILGLVGLAWKRARSFKRVPKRSTYRSAIGEGLEFGDLHIEDWMLLDGLSPDGMEFLIDVDRDKPELPDDLRALRGELEVINERNRRHGFKPVCFNGPVLSLRSFQIMRADDANETNMCRVVVSPNEYFNFLAGLGSLDRKLPGSSLTVREKYYSGIDPRSIRAPFLHGVFGINISVFTSDGYLLMVRRSDAVAAGRGEYNSAVDEGFRPDKDFENGRPSFMANVIRGLEEELHIFPEDFLSRPVLSSLGYSKWYAQYGIGGHVLLKLTLAEVKKRFKIAKDGRHEAEELVAIPATAQALSAFLVRMPPADSFISFGLASCLLALVATRFASRKEMVSAFTGVAFKKGAFLSPGPQFKPRIDTYQ